LDPISVELTYGLERICAFLQGTDSVYDLRWSDDKTYGDIRLAEEQQFSEYSFGRSDAKAIRTEFDLHEKQAKELLDGWGRRKGSSAYATPCSRLTTTALSVRTCSISWMPGSHLHNRTCRAYGAGSGSGLPHCRQLS